MIRTAWLLKGPVLALAALHSASALTSTLD
jgi:hypothetical protein